MPKSIAEQVAEMIVVLEGLEKDITKFESGNGAAGSRVRKGLKGVRDHAQAVRLEIQEIKNA